MKYKLVIKESVEQTDTTEFKKWFGNSVVVDSSGNPLVVYHGTDIEFDEFDKRKMRTGRMGKGFYFTTDIEEAKQYGSKIMACYLKINTLFNGRTRKTIGSGNPFGVEYTLQKDGGRIFIVDNPKQIKSATNNNGNFNPKSNVITEELALDVASEYFKEFDSMESTFLNNLISNKQSVLFHGSNRDFEKFDINKNRTQMNDKFYGDGIFMTPSPDVAERYAEANRNSFLDKSVIDDIKKVNREAGEFLSDLYSMGLDAFTTSKNDLKREFGGIDGNDLSDISEVIEGSKTLEVPEMSAQDIFGSSSIGLDSYHIEMLNEYFDLDYSPKLYTYKIKPIDIDDIFITDDFTEARNSNKEVVIVVEHEELIDNIPEVRFKSDKYIDMLVSKVTI